MQPNGLPMRSIIKEFGYSRGDIRNAIVMMRRRGMGYRDSVRAVMTVNGAEAHSRWLIAQEMSAWDDYFKSESENDSE